MDSGRRPDLIGMTFGVLLVVALAAVAFKLAMPAGDSAGGALRRLLPVFGDDPAAADNEIGAIGDNGIGLGSPGRGRGGPLSPLYYDGPRELEPPAPHEPDELAVPGLGLRTRLLRLDKRPDGRMEVPGDFGLAGWYVRSPAPGHVGPAVIAGHLDSRRGPAVFARLGELEPGDEILVRRGDGHVVRFTVRKVAQYPKASFPTQEVYGDTAGPELRLITCDGEFDRTRRSYDRNLVVYAVADPKSVPPPDETFTPVPGASSSPGSGSPSGSPSPGPSGSGGSPGGSGGSPGGSGGSPGRPGGSPGASPSPTPNPSPSPSGPGPAPSPSPSPTSSGLPTKEPTPAPSRGPFGLP